ncbi:hypothetical protein ABZ924_08235 [Streptomyces sp. NPDC046876]|uniref:hypothetical protein n=1 Tax=Streptomyces sp. NPDC046876 TaxID=3155616 RepID=UPI0033E5CEF6
MTTSPAHTAAPTEAPVLVVGRLSATLRHEPGRPPPAPDPLRGPLLHAVGGRLESALRGLALPPGRWCLARLDLTLPLDLDRPDRALADDWSRAVAAAIERTVREGSAGAGGPATAVHYRHDADLLADAVTGLATGRLERLWAWRQTGLLHPEDPAPQTSPGDAALAVLARHPQQAAAAVVRAAEYCGAAALDRAWGRHGWQRLAALAAGTGTEALPRPVATAPPAPAVRARARALLAGSRLAALLRDSRLRPAEETAAAWAVLVLAETDPAALHAALHRPGLHRLLTEALRAPDRPGPPLPPAAAQGPPGEAPERPGDPGSAPPASRAAADDTAGGAPAERPPVRTPHPPAPEHAGPGPGPAPEALPAVTASDGAPTDWAGLLFLLATAAEAGLPDRALDDAALAARPLPWVLHATARTLLPAAGPDDPALLALAGLTPARAAPLLSAAPPTPRERPCLDALAAAWAQATALRLAAAAGAGAGADAVDPYRVVAALARRRGRILAEPGWIEVVLAGRDADVAVRRAGLDLDPGWLGWLGAVVRFRYV